MGRNSYFFFLAGLLRLPFDGPFAALASISATASSRVTALGSALFGKVVSMDRLVGKDFERGLAQLKSVAEA